MRVNFQNPSYVRGDGYFKIVFGQGDSKRCVHGLNVNPSSKNYSKCPEENNAKNACIIGRKFSLSDDCCMAMGLNAWLLTLVSGI